MIRNGSHSPTFVQTDWILRHIPLLLEGAEGRQDDSYLRGHARRLAYSANLITKYIRPSDKLLDIGGGMGFIGTILSHCTSVPFEYGLYEAEGVRSERYPVINHNFDGEDLRVPSESYDVVILLEVLEHLIKDPYLLIAEINRILNPAGLLVISTPNLSSVSAAISVIRGRSPLWNPIRKDVYARHNKEYGIFDLHAFSTAGGFDIVYEEASMRGLPITYKAFAYLLSLGRLSPVRRCLMGPQYYGVWRKARPASATPPWGIYHRDDYDCLLTVGEDLS